MPLLRKCPTCGGEIVDKRVEELVERGISLATVTVEAEVCLGCGQRLFDPDTVRLLEKVSKDLPVGESVDVVVTDSSTSSQRSAADILAESPGQRLFGDAEDVKSYLKAERESWER